MYLAHTPIMVHYTILSAQRVFVKPFVKKINTFLTVSASKEFFVFEAVFCGKKKHAAACRESEKKHLRLPFRRTEKTRNPDIPDLGFFFKMIISYYLPIKLFNSRSAHLDYKVLP